MAANVISKEVIQLPEETPEEKELRLVQEAEAAKLAEEAEKAKQDADIAGKDAEKAAAAEAKKEHKRLADIERNKTDNITIKGVVLKGSVAQKTGTHSIHLTPSQIVNFVDGKAQVKEDVERSLKAAGYIE